MAPKSGGPCGFSVETVKEKTGKLWTEWYAVLETWDGPSKGNIKMAKHLGQKQAFSPWWKKVVTNHQENERGLRDD